MLENIQFTVQMSPVSRVLQQKLCRQDFRDVDYLCLKKFPPLNSL